MTLIYRSVKGSELTSDEVDGNFQFLSTTKQDILTFDSVPTNGSSKPVTSDGIYDFVISQVSSIDFSPYLKKDGSVTLEEDLPILNTKGFVWASTSAIRDNGGFINISAFNGIKSNSDHYFNSNAYFDFGLDTTATVGTDTLNIGGTNADVINIGRTGKAVNILGTLNGYLSNTLTSAQVFVGNGSNVATGVSLSLSGTGGSFGLSNSGVLTFPNADTSTRGLLTSTDWNTFNGKQAALSGTGFVKITGSTISYDNSTYITGNQNITLSGDVSGSGTTSISTTISKLAFDYRINNPRMTDHMITWTTNWNRNVSGGTVSEPIDPIYGVQSLNTGTTTTGSANLIQGAASTITLGNGAYRAKFRVRFTNLSTVTDEFIAFAGLDDAQNTDAVDGVYFKYDRLNTGNFFVVVTSKASVRTSTTTSQAVVANTWYVLEISVNANATSVDFKINGSTVATHTTNIPDTIVNATTAQLSIKKSAGTTSRSMEVDYWFDEYNLTSSIS